MNSVVTPKAYLPPLIDGNQSDFTKLGFSFRDDADCRPNGFRETGLPLNCKLHPDPKHFDREVVVNPDNLVIAEVYLVQAASKFNRPPFMSLPKQERYYTPVTEEKRLAPWDS